MPACQKRKKKAISSWHQQGNSLGVKLSFLDPVRSHNDPLLTLLDYVNCQCDTLMYNSLSQKHITALTSNGWNSLQGFFFFFFNYLFIFGHIPKLTGP